MKQENKQESGKVLSFPDNGRKPVLFGTILRDARKEKRIKQETIAEMLGVSRFTIRNWECDINKPDYETLPTLCDILGISIQELFGSPLPEQTLLDREILADFHRLSRKGQIMAGNVIAAMVQVEMEEMAKELAEKDRVLKRTNRILEEVPGAVAAGTGYAFQDGVPSSPFFVKTNNANKSADAVVRVSGHSMEPDYNDGDYVYFKYTQDVFPGDDVVAGWSEGAIVKRMGDDRTLYSVNSDLPFDYDEGEDGPGVRIIGKVLGIVDPSADLPDKGDLDALQELFHDELVEFDRDHGRV